MAVNVDRSRDRTRDQTERLAELSEKCRQPSSDSLYATELKSQENFPCHGMAPTNVFWTVPEPECAGGDRKRQFRDGRGACPPRPGSLRCIARDTCGYDRNDSALAMA